MYQQMTFNKMKGGSYYLKYNNDTGQVNEVLSQYK